VTAVGPPVPGKITETGTLPAGVTFGSTGGGVGTLAGIAPLSAKGKTYSLAFEVTNTLGTTNQTFKLVVT